LKSDEEAIFISGSTQAKELENMFLDALLKELATKKYAWLSLRMGIHPGTEYPDDYLHELLLTAEKYSQTKSQFKIILTPQFEKRLKFSIRSNPFLLRCEITGAQAAYAADKITQAVPGALLNEAALLGKPAYFYERSVVPYLPKEWFSKDIATFYLAKAERSRSCKVLGLVDSAPNLMSQLMIRVPAAIKGFQCSTENYQH
jgi:hypothetical protein